MPKRKKYPKLPNGFGSIKYLGKNRRNPYAVHPPVTEFTVDGVPITPKALCYVNDWMVGFSVLTAYKAGTYYPGMEKDLCFPIESSDSGIIQRILADYTLTRQADKKQKEQEKTFAQVFHEFYHWKYELDQSRNYSESTKKNTRAAFQNCSALHGKTFASLRYPDLQNVVDSCPLKYSSKELIVLLFHQMYTYADIFELCDKNYSAHIKIHSADDDEHGVPFTEKELKILWHHKTDPVVEFLLIMCYSGFRISEYKTLEISLHDGYFKGGSKTAAGKNRIVPIHSGILDIVRERMKRYGGNLLPYGPNTYRNKLYPTLERLKIQKHTPHDCRHTFSALCEKYKVNENDRKRMLGHSFGNDITNKIYGHRDIEDLRTEIEKIRICY